MERATANDPRLRPEPRPYNEVANGFTAFRDGDLLIAKITPCFENGKGGIADKLQGGVGFGSTEFHVFRPSNRVDIRFVYYATLCKPFRDVGAAQMTGSAGQQRVPSDFIANFQLPLPPLEEQKAIADYLDANAAKVRRFIRNRRRLIELLNEQKQAVINQAVTRGLDPNTPLKPSGIDWLGDIPEHWKVSRLKFLSKMKSGEGITGLQINSNGEYPVYGGNGLRGYTSSFTHDGKFVLIGRQGALCGNIHHVSGRFWASEHAVVVTPVAGINVSWLGALLRVMNLNQYSIAAAQPGLAVERVLNLSVPVPSANEQERIAAHIESETKELSAATLNAQREINLIREYRTRLIADVVTGKMDVRRFASALGEEFTKTDDLDEGLDDEEIQEDNGPELIDESLDG
jgi:type I restriction enzyme S subunit